MLTNTIAGGHTSNYYHLQLKSLVSALYNSGKNRTKHFCKAGSYFGWDTVERMWIREVGRSERGEMAVIPRMKASYVYRDSWTRLNVTPAKIMQVLCTLIICCIKLK